MNHTLENLVDTLALFNRQPCVAVSPESRLKIIQFLAFSSELISRMNIAQVSPDRYQAGDMSVEHNSLEVVSGSFDLLKDRRYSFAFTKAVGSLSRSLPQIAEQTVAGLVDFLAAEPSVGLSLANNALVLIEDIALPGHSRTSIELALKYLAPPTGFESTDTLEAFVKNATALFFSNVDAELGRQLYGKIFEVTRQTYDDLCAQERLNGGSGAISALFAGNIGEALRKIKHFAPPKS